VPAPGGFTLLELIAVLALLATLVIAGRFTLRGPLAKARLEQALERLADLDGQARAEARRFRRPVELTFDLDAAAAGFKLSADDSAAWRRRTAAGQLVRIDQARAGGQRAADGQLRVWVSPWGQSEPYAVRLAVGDGGRYAAWLLILGVSGQGVKCWDNTTVDRVLAIHD
jgi:prepilin-type N-terminal cleavage/methylation domain-containing protein